MTSPYLSQPLRSEAEVRLAIAAPDILAALESLVTSVAPFETKLKAAMGHASHTCMPAMDKARAVIAKARKP